VVELMKLLIIRLGENKKFLATLNTAKVI